MTTLTEIRNAVKKVDAAQREYFNHVTLPDGGDEPTQEMLEDKMTTAEAELSRHTPDYLEALLAVVEAAAAFCEATKDVRALSSLGQMVEQYDKERNKVIDALAALDT